MDETGWSPLTQAPLSLLPFLVINHAAMNSFTHAAFPSSPRCLVGLRFSDRNDLVEGVNTKGAGGTYCSREPCWCFDCLQNQVLGRQELDHCWLRKEDGASLISVNRQLRT